MPIQITCGACGKKVWVRDDLDAAKCPSCATPIRAADEPENEGREHFSMPDKESKVRSSTTTGTASTVHSLTAPVPIPFVIPTVPKRKHGPVVNLHQATRSASRSLIRRRAYFVFALALLPLAIVTVISRHDVLIRLKSTLDRHPEIVSRLGESFSIHDGELFDALPESRIDGAWLPRYSLLPLAIALISLLVALLLIVFLFERGGTSFGAVGQVAVITGTVGVILLLAFQQFSWLTLGVLVVGGGLSRVLRYFDGGKLQALTIAVVIGIQLFAFFYFLADNPDVGFPMSLVGFIFGVGFCEELVKCTPLLFKMDDAYDLDWRGMCALGLASGAGFAAAEGVIYSLQIYNGIYPVAVYIVRFVSCIALHAVWTASVGIGIFKQQNTLQSEGVLTYLETLGKILALPVALHGLYDAFLKFGWEWPALGIAGLSFAFLAWQIESARRDEARILDAASAKLLQTN